MAHLADISSTTELEYAGLDEAAIALLRRQKAALLAALPGIVGRFYDRTTSHPELGKLFRDAAHVTAAKAAQTRHWTQLFEAKFDDAYRASAEAVGQAHHRVDLSPQHYVAGYGYILGELLQAVVLGQRGLVALPGRRQEAAQALAAIVRAVLYDLNLAMTTYWRAQLAERDAMIDAMVARIDTEAGETTNGIKELSSVLLRSSHAMDKSCLALSHDTSATDVAANGALASVQTVASAVEELNASSAEIGNQVAQAAAAARDAVARMQGAHAVVRRLGDAADEIGKVVSLIGDIAGQTNLLALNATIEAARAGDAGKGFAVVAGEVKNLAGQSAKSAGEISTRIATIQEVSAETARTIDEIATAIGTMEATSTAIAAAVEEQTAATAEIARCVTVTADHVGDVNRLMESTKASVIAAREASVDVDISANRLDSAMTTLARTLTKALRSASTLADRRRSARYAVLLEGEVHAAGRAERAQVYDLSESGAMVGCKTSLSAGATVTLTVPSEDIRVAATVAANREDRLHLRFDGASLPAEKVRTVARASVGRLVELTKADHRAFVQRIKDAVDGKLQIDPRTLAAHHDCRLGRWYDSVSDENLTALPAFKALNDPHIRVHHAGHEVLEALAVGEADLVAQSVAAMDAASAEVIALLDRMGAEAQQRWAAAA